MRREWSGCERRGWEGLHGSARRGVPGPGRRRAVPGAEGREAWRERQRRTHTRGAGGGRVSGWESAGEAIEYAGADSGVGYGYAAMTMIFRRPCGAGFQLASRGGLKTRRRLKACPTFLIALGVVASAQTPDRALLDRYCVTCHNERAKTGGLALNALDPSRPGEHAETWEKVVRKIRAGMMPPSGAQRPDRAALDGLAARLEGELDRAAAAHPNPGSTALHRLNRNEYANAIRDLLALDMDATTLLPADDSAAGFGNVAEGL